MKKTLLTYFVFVIGSLLLFFSVSLPRASAETTPTDTIKTLTDQAVTIFTSDTCEFCEELETELKKDYESDTYKLRNIDTSDEIKKEYQIALVTCGKAEGTVPMILHNNTCISGKEQILNVFKDIKSAQDIDEVANADVTKTSIIADTLSDFTNIAFVDELSVTDYAIGGVLLLVFLVGLFLMIRQRGSTNKRAKLMSTFAFVLPMLGVAAFMFMKVNSFNDLSSTAADAGKKSSNCLSTNSCKDWNEFVKAKAENAKNEGRHGDSKEWESKVIDQKIINAQLADANNALIKTLKDNPSRYCGSGATSCTYAQFLNATKKEADKICSGTSNECKEQQAKKYMEILYGKGATDEELKYKEGDGKTSTDAVGGLFKEAIKDYKAKKLEEAYLGLINKIGEIPAKDRLPLYAELTKLCNCVVPTTIQGQIDLFKQYQNQLDDKFFKFVATDTFTGMGIYVPDTKIYNPSQSDECETATSGGACPVGTATCICQEKPVFRATCAAIGQNCEAVCKATHNICEDKCTDKVITKEDTEKTPSSQESSCQQACSATSPCTDGTSCVNGKCINPSCPSEADCLCGTSTTPICGDGVINESPQSPEQCELGNPAGTSCSWDSCNQNTCKCPDTNPNWDITKTSAVVCVNNGTSNVYAQIKYNISATYINSTSPTTVGTLERVIDRPENYMSTWLDAASITNGGAHANAGGLISTITWDLSGDLSKFTIPSGQTQVTKDNFLSYTFNVPKEFFGRYVNLVTGYPNQTTDDNSFSYTNSIYIACSVPSTAFDSNSVKTLVGIFLIASGIVFAYSQRESNLVNRIVASPLFEGVSMVFASKDKKEHLKKISFEDKVLKRAKKK